MLKSPESATNCLFPCVCTCAPMRERVGESLCIKIGSILHAFLYLPVSGSFYKDVGQPWTRDSSPDGAWLHSLKVSVTACTKTLGHFYIEGKKENKSKLLLFRSPNSDRGNCKWGLFIIHSTLKCIYTVYFPLLILCSDLCGSLNKEKYWLNKGQQKIRLLLTYWVHVPPPGRQHIHLLWQDGAKDNLWEKNNGRGALCTKCVIWKTTTNKWGPSQCADVIEVAGFKLD